MQEPVFATATVIGRSAVAVFRITGSGVLEIISSTLKGFHDKPVNLRKKADTIVRARIYDGDDIIDEVLVLPFAGPRSFTGEDMVEIHTHGNMLILKKLAHLCFKHGIQKAGPGEFTRRAYFNNKIDLTEAEAIREIIDARNEHMLQKAQALKQGSFRDALFRVKEKLLHITADITAELDYVDEDLDFTTSADHIKTIEKLSIEIEQLITRSDQLDIFRNNLELVILGAVNAGKSSLLNRLSGAERAIVSDTAGTTRDYIYTDLHLHGIDLRLVDTAGLRNTGDEIENRGIQRSLEQAANADLILLIIDSSKNKKESINDMNLVLHESDFFKATHHILLVLNKVDNAHSDWQRPDEELLELFKEYQASAVFRVSAKTGAGIETLQQALTEYSSTSTGHSEAILMPGWQKEIFRQIGASLQEAALLFSEAGDTEIVVSILRDCLDDIGRITGNIDTEELLDHVFSRFCVGK